IQETQPCRAKDNHRAKQSETCKCDPQCNSQVNQKKKKNEKHGDRLDDARLPFWRVRENPIVRPQFVVCVDSLMLDAKFPIRIENWIEFLAIVVERRRLSPVPNPHIRV